MAFVTRPAFNGPSFNPLFRLMEDYDRYSKGDSSSAEAPSIQWQPKFDIRETSDSYYLHGELPGVNKEHISIEFPELQTLVIHGKSERTYTSGSADDAAKASSRRNSHQATVEDEADAEAAKPEAVVEQKKPADTAKYWLAERNIGGFSRSFTFGSRIEEEGISAKLQDGILTVVIPKAKQYETRRVVVN
ncbi:unnamed protein product [Clonostachys rosea]|uniref:SHSP domain-containing protein n=1 Tax=Bionectria ochroleuca TaxID=29856 RepID=A0ABY6URZ1_BIOOC|nr:unnamed protein product [Clonostachys rosea]